MFFRPPFWEVSTCRSPRGVGKAQDLSYSAVRKQCFVIPKSGPHCAGIDINVLCIRLRIPQGEFPGAGHGTDIDDAWVSMQWHQVKSTTGCGKQTGADTHCLFCVQITWAFCSACAYVLDTWNNIPFMCIYLNLGPVSQKNVSPQQKCHGFHHTEWCLIKRYVCSFRCLSVWMCLILSV